MSAGQGCGGTDAILSVEAALELLLNHARPVPETETRPLYAALGRMLAAPIASPVDLPPWDNSAMDGYAVRSADVAEHRDHGLPVSQRIPAGSRAEPLAPGTAARIFTGAPVPPGADTVVIQEDCEALDNGTRVRLPARVSSERNIRYRGEQVRAGAEVLPAGTRLGPQHLAVAASVGCAELLVRRRLKVAIFASGDELVEPGQPLGDGQIYNSNRALFHALLGTLGCDVLDLGIVADTREATRAALARGAEQADLVLASGGVSVGEEDHVRPAVEELGRLELWRVAMRPGRPLAFGQVGDTPFIGSPGNPVSLFVTFCLFARPFILRLQGMEPIRPPRGIRAAAGFDCNKPLKRREYRRARLVDGAEGAPPSVEVYASNSSADLMSLTWADGLVEVPEQQVFSTGYLLTFLPFSELLNLGS